MVSARRGDKAAVVPTKFAALHASRTSVDCLSTLIGSAGIAIEYIRAALTRPLPHDHPESGRLLRQHERQPLLHGRAATLAHAKEAVRNRRRRLGVDAVPA
jgi:hypothetical protein